MLTRFLQSLKPLARIFRPPFDGLIWMVVLFYGWCFLVYPESQTLRGNLPDPDDYMYLNQLNDWLGNHRHAGQSWFDNVQHRLNAPEGVAIHFARITQLPMALIAGLFRLIGFGPRASGLLMATFYPLFLLGGLLVALRWAAQNFVPQKWAGASSYVALFATGMMFFFMPGHIDHHNVIIVIIALVLGCLCRMTREPDNHVWGITAGLLMALGQCVALEILPWLLVLSTWIGLWAASKGGKATLNALGYGIALHLGSILFLLTYRPPSDFFANDILTYSFVYVLLTGGIAVSMAGVAIGQKYAVLRWILGGGLATVTGGLFLHQFPDLISGPYGGISPELANMILGEVDEAQPLLKNETSFIVRSLYLLPPLLAMGYGVWFWRRAKDSAERWRWTLLLTMLVAAFGLTVFYQYRFMGVMGLMTVLPLTTMLYRGWQRIGKMPMGQRQLWAQIGLILLVGPLPTVLYPALIDGRSFNKGILLFPVDSEVTHNSCDMYELEKILGNPHIYGDHPRQIMNVMSQGPELLFRTPHQVLAAPFHTNVTGNVDALRFFSTPYPTEAEAIARRRHIDLVVACRLVPKILTRAPSTQANNEHDFAPHFIELLTTSKYPGWLRPMRFPGLHNYVIYEVLPEAKPPQSDRTH